MFSCRWTTLAGVVLIGIVSACRPSGYAYLQAQHNVYSFPTTTLAPAAVQDTIPAPAKTKAYSVALANQTDKPTEPPSVEKLRFQPKPAHLKNPEAPVRKPTNAWLTKSGLLEPISTSYAYERPTIQPTKRRTPTLAHGAFAGGLLSYAASVFSAAGGWMWIVATTLPLLTALVGVAGLTKITRNREQYRGKGWAISAILLGTGVLGMIWVALFALATSKVIWG